MNQIISKKDIVKIDLQNAFNSLNRKLVEKVLIEKGMAETDAKYILLYLKAKRSDIV